MARGGRSWRVRRIRDPFLRETLTQARRPGGPTLLHVRSRGVLQKFAAIGVGYGAAHLAFRAGGGPWRRTPPGVAHFLEHQLFEGESANAFAFFARLGASANAYTDYAETVYHVSCVDRFREALAHLVRFVCEPRFTEKTVAKERDVIAEEIRMYADDPDSVCVQGLHRALFSRHPARLDVAGTLAAIRRVTPAMLYACYRAFYHPSRMVVVVVADLPTEEVAACVARAFAETGRAAGLGGNPWRPPRPRVWRESAGVARRAVRRVLPVALPKALVGFKEGRVGLAGPALVAQRLATVFLGDILFGPGSDLRERLTDEGLADEEFGFGYQGGPDFGYSVVGGRTRDPAALRRAILGEIARAVREGIDRDDFERVRTKAIGAFLRTFHAPSALGRILLSCHLAGTDLFDYSAVLFRMTPEALARHLREHFREDRSAMSVVAPA